MFIAEDKAGYSPLILPVAIYIADSGISLRMAIARGRFDRDDYQSKLTLPGFPLELGIHGISTGYNFH